MEGDSRSLRRYASSRSYLSALKSHSDYCFDFEEFEEDDEEVLCTDYPCPFCDEDYDLISLCCHIDEEHPMEAKSGVCPVCATRMSTDVVRHITTQHRHLLKSIYQPKPYSSESYSMFSSSRKDMRFERFRTGVSATVATSKPKPDPFLSFINNALLDGQSKPVEPEPPIDLDLGKTSSDKETIESKIESASMSDQDQVKKAKRSEFLQELLLSTIFDGEL